MVQYYCYEHVDHALFEIMYVCLLYFMLVGSAFKERKEFGHLVSRRSLLAMWFWCLFFKMSRSQLVDGIVER
jgi:hypothetical protein